MLQRVSTVTLPSALFCGAAIAPVHGNIRWQELQSLRRNPRCQWQLTCCMSQNAVPWMRRWNSSTSTKSAWARMGPQRCSSEPILILGGVPIKLPFCDSHHKRVRMLARCSTIGAAIRPACGPPHIRPVSWHFFLHVQQSINRDDVNGYPDQTAP